MAWVRRLKTFSGKRKAEDKNNDLISAPMISVDRERILSVSGKFVIFG
jgi:hypothetical protein